MARTPKKKKPPPSPKNNKSSTRGGQQKSIVDFFPSPSDKTAKAETTSRNSSNNTAATSRSNNTSEDRASRTDQNKPKHQPAVAAGTFKTMEGTQKYDIGTKFFKEFDGEDFEGKIVSFEAEDGLYHVVYEDGDEEDLETDELDELLLMREIEPKPKKGKKSSANAVVDAPPPPKTEATRSGRRVAKITYNNVVDLNEEDDDDEEEEVRPSKRSRGANVGRGRPAKKTKAAPSSSRKKNDNGDEDSDFSMGGAPSDDEDLDSEMEIDEEEDEEEEVKKPKAKRTKAPSKKSTTATNTVAAKTKGKNKSDGKGDSQDDEFERKLKKDLESFKPNNNPQKLPEQDYVDPVGVDPTHGIVEGIVSAQVRKIGKLLDLSLAQQQQDSSKKNMTFPIRLQTACSGTDAPSIALGLIKESLDKVCDSNDRERIPFDYEHVMSCEIEPFKQAYLGRNFPGVPLFPDITKLTASQEVLDVYGRPQHIPEGNLFVAGTSCKDFSMLKTRDRLDIEDKGTSGETFLGAVEFLEKYQPPMAIFENVDGAPWGKMQEYIQGRIYLPDRNETKAIKAGKAANADVDLKFSVNENGQYVAEEVPRQVGIRAGAIVEGFVKGGNKASNVRPLKADDNRKGPSSKFISLGELAKKHQINLKADTLVMMKEARYCTHLCKLDTKDYGLPQTRNRKYLFLWRSDDPDDDLGKKFFQEILDHLKTPLLHSMDAFLLPDTHDRIRCFREALRSGPGLMVKRDRARESDFWNWEESRVKDLTVHLAFRQNNGIAERSRWLTGWDTRGRKMLAPGLWPELFDCWNMRRLDMVDCFAAAAIRDAISRDPLHHSFTWDLSQNVTRAPFRSATVGVSGCVTPGGELLLPRKGRTVMGYEKLLLQGIPYSRLLLGPETEVQLSDLAGNAMSVPVIAAVQLAAICAPELRRQRLKNPTVQLNNLGLSLKHDTASGGVLPERGDLYNTTRNSDASDFTDVFQRVLQDLALDAFRSSVLCTCESSGTTTTNPRLLQCSGCGWRVCHDCSSRYQTCSHALTDDSDVRADGDRPDPHEFERRLRCVVPSILRLGKDAETSLENGEGLSSYSFQLQEVLRRKNHWQLTYGAWEDHGSGRQVAEIRVAVGKIGTLDEKPGVAAYVRCFAPAIRQKKPLRGVLKDSARIFFKEKEGDSSSIPQWEVPNNKKKTKVTLEIVGSDPCDSQRVMVGLSDEANKSLRGHKVKNAFLPKIESRNAKYFTEYHPHWKKWPGSIVVSGDTSDRVNGTYRKLSCQHTVVLSGLWRRDSSEDQSPMYFYYRPNVVRAGLDVAVFSPTPSYEDGLEICELHDWIPENAMKSSTHATKATFQEWTDSAGNFKIEVPVPTLQVSAPTKSFHDMVCAMSDQDSPSPILCEMNGLSQGVIKSLLEYCDPAEECNGACTIDLLGRSGTRNAKRLGIIAAPSLLKFAAECQLPLKLSKWYRLPTSSQWGSCEINVPSRPVEKWQEIPGREGAVERVYDAEESNEYYQKLYNRPTAFEVSVVKSHGKLLVRMNPQVAAHRAAAQVGGELTDNIEVDYCLSELSSMGEPDTKEFHVPNSDSYDETVVAGLELPLYPRQAKALTRMLAIEAGEVPFSEEERSEIILPGIGWCLQARATKQSPLRGGVLGDAIGSGKTVVTIAFILAGVSKARRSRNINENRSSATLIVVPPGLVHQWNDERKKFTKDKLKCIVIDCTDTLKKYSVQDLCEADIVLVPASLIEEANGQKRPYTEHLSRKSGAGRIPPAPLRHSQREAPTIEGTWVRNMASGPEIYVGNRGDQRKRDEQAYYGHCYSEAIAKLRGKTFGSAERGVPLEYFTWERVVIDECHETLVTGKSQEGKSEDFKEKARRGAREFLGVSQTDIAKRPLVAASGVWGLTGTPLLETEARVTELANLMGGTYLTGAAHHWRKEERESGRDLFLNQQEATRSREYRCAVQEACHTYVQEACQRNRGEVLLVQKYSKLEEVNMTSMEGDAFLKATKDMQLDSFSVTADQLGEKVDDALRITASSTARHSKLLETIDSIHETEPETKVIIFANSSYGGYDSALTALKRSGKGYSHVVDTETVERQNEIIGWFRHVDVTPEEKARPRILLLSFEQAAGHNLQEACHNVILFDPMYSGSDAVADASVEEQAVGRVMRQGQKDDVTVTRIIVKGPKGEKCLDNWIVERNLDDDVLKAATSNFD